MAIRDRVAALAVNIRPQPAVTAAGGGVAAPNAAFPGVPYTTTPTPPVVSQQPTPVPSAAAAAVAAALARPPSAAAAPPPPAAGGGGVSIDSIFGQGALATLLSGAARKSVTPQQTATPTPQPPPAVPAVPALGPAATAAIAAALRSPPPQRPAEPARPASAAPPPSDPSALLAMLRQSGLLKPGATPTPPQAAPVLQNLGGFQSLAGVVTDRSLQLKPASLKM
jgi:pre-mRNA cleavage complex 2 protein Pcf11